MSVPRVLPSLLSLLLAPALAARQEGETPSRPMPRPVGPSGDFRTLRSLEPERRASPVHPQDAIQAGRFRIVEPRATPRCAALPTPEVWQHRDIFKEIQAMSRQGCIPVLAVGGDIDALQDYAFFPAGWKAYGFVVPPEGELEVHLDHPNLGWFRLAMVNKWGSLQRGMLQNLIPKGTPMVTYKNLEKTSQQVFVIADDPGWMSSKQTPYKITIQRSWDGKQTAPDSLPPVLGIWARRGSLKASKVAGTPVAADPGKGAPQP